MNYKMILPNIFTKKYHRSIINSIEVSLNHHDACKKAFFEDLCLEIQAQKLRNV